MNNSQVSVLMGSESDLPVMKFCLETLDKLGVTYNVRVLSAHRTPDELVSYIKKEGKEGVKVFIAAAGGAAHLAGSVAAQTLNPVIGVPLSASDLNGMDSLLSTVQMPKGIPVATVAIGKAGAINAAFLSAQILGINDPELVTRMKTQREDAASKILATKIEL